MQCEKCTSLDFFSCIDPEFCSAGTWADPNIKRCSLCPTNQLALASHNSCVEKASDCDIGTYGNLSTFQCTQCQSESFAKFDHSGCGNELDCGNGHYGNKTFWQCFPCPNGTISYHTFTKCVFPTQCGEGYFPNMWKKKCDCCGTGCLKCLNEEYCLLCINSFFSYRGKCYKQCPIQTYFNYFNTSCEDCCGDVGLVGY